VSQLKHNKVTLVDFLRSIKFNHRPAANHAAPTFDHFAELQPQVRPARRRSAEDALLVRSAN